MKDQTQNEIRVLLRSAQTCLPRGRVGAFATSVLLTILVWTSSPICAAPFTYQGQLTNGGTVADGSYDFQFSLYSTLIGGSSIGNPVSVNDTTVTDGHFTVQLDFGNQTFDGTGRWLEIAVRPGVGNSPFETLRPRQSITASPVAQFAVHGNPGPAGIQGVKGDKGDPGARGATGPQGDVGPQGPEGDKGNPGANGATGPPGVPGPQGLKGDKGNPGAPGIAGPPGATGARGPKGEKGDKGDPGSVDGWSRTGNSGTNPGTNFLGTTDSQPFEIRAENDRTIVWSKSADQGIAHPNFSRGFSGRWDSNGVTTLGGHKGNTAESSLGATVFGGGASTVTIQLLEPINSPPPPTTSELSLNNSVSNANFAVISGGARNSINNTDFHSGLDDHTRLLYAAGTIGGGLDNKIDGAGWATIAGGYSNLVSGDYGFAAGDSNTVSGTSGFAAGNSNTVSGNDGFAVGTFNTVSGISSFAAGHLASSKHDGCFVWADSQEGEFASSASNQFLIQAKGGVGINTNQIFSTLNLKQGTDLAADGIRIERADNTNAWTISHWHDEDLRISHSNGNVTWLDDQGSGFIQTSDRRFKKDIEALRNTLDKVNQLKPSSYHYTHVADPDAPKALGFIAQDVEPLFPELVTKKDDRKTLAYTGFIPINTRAIQELHDLVEDQQEALAKQAAQIAELQHLVRKMTSDR